MLSILLLVMCLVLCLVYSMVLPRPSSPPMLRGKLPIIGHGHQVLGDLKYMYNFLHYIFKYSVDKGGVIEGLVGTHSFYVITDPDDGLFVANTCLNKPYFYDFAKAMLKNGLITADASSWRSHRKLLNPMFNQRVLNTFMDEINFQARTLVSQLASEVGKEPFTLRRYLVSYTLKAISRTTLGLRPQEQLSKEYTEAFEAILDTFVIRFQKTWLHVPFIYNRSKLKKKHDELMKTLNKNIDPIIQKRISEWKTNKQSDIGKDGTTGKQTSLLNRMLFLIDEQDIFSYDEIREHLDTFVVAAFDTTSSALEYTLLVIGSYPDIQQRIFNELKEVFSNKNADCTKDDLPKLLYLEAVMKETMRLYPAVPLIGRKLHTDVKLKNCILRSGNSCVVGLTGIHRHPMWGADAEQFRPERWLDPATLPDNPNAFAAFGLGKRSCIGKSYALMVMKTALAHILRRFHITSDISQVVSQYGIVNKPIQGNHISLTLRS